MEDLFCYYLKNSGTYFTSVILKQTFSVINNFKNSCTYCTSIIFSIITLKTRAHIAQVQCHSLLYIKFDEFLPLFMPEKNHMIAGIVTKVLPNPKVQTHWKAFKK